MLDFSGMISSVLAKYKNTPFLKRHTVPVLVGMNLFLAGIGCLLYENIFSLFAMLGIIFETTALWITSETHIRRLSLVAAPFWLIYNVANHAYGSAVGNVLAIVSIVIAMLRYDREGKRGQ